MPRIIRFMTGETSSLPRPIETAPATRIVKQYAGSKYLVFIDETFRQFFGFPTPNGYLCYAAVGVPAQEYEYLKRAMAKIFKSYELTVVGDSGLTLQEFKFEQFRRIPLDIRKKLASQISKTLKIHGAFLIGFYTHVCGVVMERVRVNQIGDASEVPLVHNALYSKAVEELRREFTGIAQSETIAHILRNPLLGMANFLAYFNCPFQVFCDPRESKEDKAVIAGIDWFIQNRFKVAAPKEAALYLGIDNSRPSHSEVGLQMADLLAGEIRLFFEDHPDLLTFGASNKLITGDSREEAEWWEEAQGIFQKLGRIIKLPTDLTIGFKQVTGTSCLPLYRHLFASGLLTCFSDIGAPRHIELFEENAFDQTD
jgi:hypothetical protein